MLFSTNITKSYAQSVAGFTASLTGSIILTPREFKEDMPEKSLIMIGSVNKLIATTLVFILSLSTATVTFAQSSPDTRSPVIELEAVAEAQADAAQVFTAQVVDDRLLKDVTLYYRRDGQQAFSTLTMNAIAETAYFTASITTDPADLRAIQYYVQARDEGGNRTVQGYAFDPYTRVLLANEAVVNAATTVAPTQTTTTKSSGVRWWQVALGIVVVGALAAAASGSSGGGSSDEGGVPLTVTVTGL